jgi:hypothetical protein
MEITSSLQAEIERMVLAQIKAHIGDCPVESAVLELKAERDKVRESLLAIQKKLNGIWANGSGGPPGYLELLSASLEKTARERNDSVDEQFQRLFTVVSDIKKDKYRAEGAAEQLGKDKLDAVQVALVRRDWLRMALMVGTMGGGAWLFDLIKLLVVSHFH